MNKSIQNNPSTTPDLVMIYFNFRFQKLAIAQFDIKMQFIGVILLVINSNTHWAVWIIAVDTEIMRGNFANIRRN